MRYETNLTTKLAFTGVGVATAGLTGWEIAIKMVSHGMVGGISSEIQGGTFNDGFITAGLSAGAAPYAGNVVKAALIGGAISSLNGGKFATGAVTSAMGYAFNYGKHEGAGQKNYAITDVERQLVADGNIQGFWESRLAGGDPVARAGLASLNSSGGAVDYFFGGTSINNRLQAFANVYAGGVLNINQVRVDLANAHIGFTDGDKFSVRGLLNPSQIAEYHHGVFERHSLPPTAFGGTPFTGAVGEANFTRRFWCGGCDTR